MQDYYCDIILREAEAMQEKVERLLELLYMDFGLERAAEREGGLCRTVRAPD